MARIHELASKVGLIFRQLSGQDIGIDSVLELPKRESELPRQKDRSLQGSILVQIKGRKASQLIAKRALNLVFTQRNDKYWLAQRLPLVICAVAIKAGTKGARCQTSEVYWIDYQALDKDDASDGSALTRYKKSGARLKVPLILEGEKLHICKKSDDAIGALDLWLRAVLKRAPERAATRAVDKADDFLNAGLPRQAEQSLEDLALWQRELLDSDQLRNIQLKTAKTLRRLGRPEKIEELIKRSAPPNCEQKFNRIMQFELALGYWTRGWETANEHVPDDWNKARKIISEQTSSATTPGSVADLEVREGELIWAAALVNIESTRVLPKQARSEPALAEHALTRLRSAIDVWKTQIVGTASGTNKTEKDNQYSKLLNALRALARGYLSRYFHKSVGEDLNMADGALKEIRSQIIKRPDPQTLALLDYLILQAWFLGLSGEVSRACELLDGAKRLTETIHDPVLRHFAGLVENALVPVSN